MKKFVFLLSAVFFSQSFFGQSSAVGEWVDYSAYHSTNMVAVGPDFAYASAAYGLIEFTRGDNSLLRYSKVEGLSDIGISSVGYNSTTNTYLVGYTNGKLDLLLEDEIVTLTDVFRKTISGNKSINNFFMVENFAYISTGFGVLKFDVDRQEFSETYLVAPNGNFVNCYDLTVQNDTIFVASEIGIRKAYINDPDLGFYETWEPESSFPLPGEEVQLIESYMDRLYARVSNDSTDVLYLKEGVGSWSEVIGLADFRVNSLAAYESEVVIAHTNSVNTYDLNWTETDRIFNYGENVPVNSNWAIKDAQGGIWVADDQVGMVYVPKPFSYTIVHPPSPQKNKVDGIDILNNEIWIAAGGRENNWNNVFSNDGVFYRTQDLTWDDINKFQDPKLEGVFDIISVKIDPFNTTRAYGGSMGGGLVQFTDYQVSEVFDDSNSPLVSVPVRGVNISDLIFDGQGTLWMANSLNPNCIAAYTQDGKWYSYEFGSLITEDLTGSIIVDQSGFKWVTLPNAGKGILVFDDGGTLDDTSDDQSRILNGAPGSGGLPTQDIYSIAMDHDGEIWVGTSEGVGVFYAPSSVFTPGVNIDAQRIIVEVNGYFQYLLGTETVTAIAVDGANRKWFGTKGSGVFLMSADGTQQLHHFTTDNSPLLSNFIRTIKINELTGEVLFGTDDGIIAFKNTATGEEALTQETYAYPNPVPENYTGMIAIKGLATNSEVRITDVAGNLVFSTVAEGTQAVWNGNDMNGNRVATGVYLVFGVDIDGNNSQVAKILFSR